MPPHIRDCNTPSLNADTKFSRSEAIAEAPKFATRWGLGSVALHARHIEYQAYKRLMACKSGLPTQQNVVGCVPLGANHIDLPRIVSYYDAATCVPRQFPAVIERVSEFGPTGVALEFCAGKMVVNGARTDEQLNLLTHTVVGRMRNCGALHESAQVIVITVSNRVYCANVEFAINLNHLQKNVRHVHYVPKSFPSANYKIPRSVLWDGRAEAIMYLIWYYYGVGRVPAHVPPICTLLSDTVKTFGDTLPAAARGKRAKGKKPASKQQQRRRRQHSNGDDEPAHSQSSNEDENGNNSGSSNNGDDGGGGDDDDDSDDDDEEDDSPDKGGDKLPKSHADPALRLLLVTPLQVMRHVRQRIHDAVRDEENKPQPIHDATVRTGRNMRKGMGLGAAIGTDVDIDEDCVGFGTVGAEIVAGASGGGAGAVDTTFEGFNENFHGPSSVISSVIRQTRVVIAESGRVNFLRCPSTQLAFCVYYYMIRLLAKFRNVRHRWEPGPILHQRRVAEWNATNCPAPTMRPTVDRATLNNARSVAVLGSGWRQEEIDTNRRMQEMFAAEDAAEQAQRGSEPAPKRPRPANDPVITAMEPVAAGMAARPPPNTVATLVFVNGQVRTVHKPLNIGQTNQGQGATGQPAYAVSTTAATAAAAAARPPNWRYGAQIAQRR